jgi:hypothetical protein
MRMFLQKCLSSTSNLSTSAKPDSPVIIDKRAGLEVETLQDGCIDVHGQLTRMSGALS